MKNMNKLTPLNMSNLEKQTVYLKTSSKHFPPGPISLANKTASAMIESPRTNLIAPKNRPV